jgi:hypothetical protein
VLLLESGRREGAITMPVTMKQTPSPQKKSPAGDSMGIDMKSTKFGGDRSKSTVYKGPKAKKDSRYATGPILADEAAGGGWGVHATGATVGMDEVQDKRNKFEQEFDKKQAAWQDNEDRNDDALYHRSFDDGSMHLVSSQYRDGKPVDNHGKEIGGMGAAAITKYRRHDLQGSTIVGESAYVLALQHTRARDPQPLRSRCICRRWLTPPLPVNRVMHPLTSAPLFLSAPCHMIPASPSRVPLGCPPSPCPHTHTHHALTRLALPAPMACRTFTPLEEDNSTLRYFAATVVKEHERGYVHPDLAKKGAAPWDNAPYRAVPYPLRGMKTVTNEPWVEDVKANPETNYATSCLSRLDDGQNDSAVQLFQRRLEENSKIAANRGLMPWHESPVLWRFPSGQAGRSIEYGETATTLKNEYHYTTHIQNGQNMNMDEHIGATHILR